MERTPQRPYAAALSNGQLQLLVLLLSVSWLIVISSVLVLVLLTAHCY